MSREGETLALQETSGPLTRLKMAGHERLREGHGGARGLPGDRRKQQNKLREGQIAKDLLRPSGT